MNKDINKLRKYFAKDLGWGWTREYQAQCVFNFLVDAAKFCEEGVVLDAGAGHQRYKPFFDKSLYLSQEHMDGINHKGMHKINYDLISPIDVLIPLKDNCVDGVISTSVVEHLLYPEAFCIEAFRVLKPGGRLFINVPFVLYEHEKPYDFNRPTSFLLKKWLLDSGFEDFSIKPSSSCVEAVCNMLPSAVYIDLLHSDERYNILVPKVMHSESNIGVKVLFILRFIVAAIFYLITSIFCFLLKLIIDRGPHYTASLPIGWVVVATKSGKRVSTGLLKRETFLKKYRK